MIRYDVAPDDLGTAELFYGPNQDNVEAAQEVVPEEPLDTSIMPVEVDVARVGDLPNDQYALLRRNGFGGSDSSVLLGVNPYKTIDELIKEKSTPILTAEEKLTGQKKAVRMGNDLEPIVILKHGVLYDTEVLKPIDMYKYPAYPHIKMNFDGVAYDELEKHYYPVEIKICSSKASEKHYNEAKALSIEGQGFINPIPIDVSDSLTMTIHDKARHYGIPPYYYTQLQAEIMACGEKCRYGYLSVMYMNDWYMRTWFVWRDDKVLNDLIINAQLAWDKVVANRLSKGYPEIFKVDTDATKEADAPSPHTLYKELEEDKYSEAELSQY